MCSVRRGAIWVPLVALLLSDALLGLVYGYGVFHATTWAVYLGFALFGAIGLSLREKRSPGLLFGGVLLGSVLFFLLTNTAAWMSMPYLYARTAGGWIPRCWSGSGR